MSSGLGRALLTPPVGPRDDDRRPDGLGFAVLALGELAEVRQEDLDGWPARGLDAVLVLDLFGTYVRILAEDIAKDVETVYTRGERMFVVLPYRLLVYDLNGLLLRIYDVHLGEPLRDVVVADGAFFLLTERRLVRAMP
ncbi:MAG: hypothetical protein IIA54_06450 [Chloroflexi bacterium]|nr:hypothetical protein [Chloroflexota bacterium]